MVEGLVLYDNAQRALAEAPSVDEVKDIRDKAVAMQVYATRAKDRDLIEKAVEIRFHAERQAGEILIEMEERGERATCNGDRRSKPPEATLIPIADLRVTKTESGRWQKLATLEEPAFEVSVAAIKKQALSPGSLSKADIRQRRAEREVRLGAFQAALPDRRYGVIYADPPWRRETWSRETGLDRSGETHCACFKVGGHREPHGLKSKGFRLSLHRIYYERLRAVPGRDVISAALALLEAVALFDDPKCDVFMRRNARKHYATLPG
jgi:hypothetical protein